MKTKDQDKQRQAFVEEIRKYYKLMKANAQSYTLFTNYKNHYDELVTELRYYDSCHGYLTDMTEWKD